jgi:hypothetical protein
VTDAEEELGKKLILRGEFGNSQANKKAKKDLETQLKLKSKKHFQSDDEDAQLVKMKQENDVTIEKENDDLKKHLDELDRYRDMLYRKNQSQWLYYLNCGFNLLFYGVGCKRDILNYFVTNNLSQDPIMIMNGYHSSVSMKTITKGMVKFASKNLHHFKSNGVSVHDQIESIKRAFDSFRPNEYEF